MMILKSFLSYNNLFIVTFLINDIFIVSLFILPQQCLLIFSNDIDNFFCQSSH